MVFLPIAGYLRWFERILWIHDYLPGSVNRLLNDAIVEHMSFCSCNLRTFESSNKSHGVLPPAAPPYHLFQFQPSQSGLVSSDRTQVRTYTWTHCSLQVSMYVLYSEMETLMGAHALRVSLEQGFDLPPVLVCHFVPSYFHGGCHQTIVNRERFVDNQNRSDTEGAVRGPGSQFII